MGDVCNTSIEVLDRMSKVVRREHTMFFHTKIVKNFKELPFDILATSCC
jgi:hypothetical protein